MTSGDSDRTQRLPRTLLAGEGLDRDLRATLTVLKGPNVGAVYSIDREVTRIGRSPDAEIQLGAEGVSRRHAEITMDDGRYMLADLGSTNGTICRGTLLDGQLELADGDRISLGGRIILRFSKEGRLEEQLRRHLYTLATRDSLTGAYNRRYLEERLSSEWAWALRHGNTCTLLLIDLDHFKVVNDTFGHIAGDKVLRGVVSVLIRTVRREDLVARFGGEEFAVLCRGTTLRAALVLGERLRAAIEKIQFKNQGVQVPVTISVGIATSADDGVSSPELLVERADQHLYEAKNKGRNRCHPQT